MIAGYKRVPGEGPLDAEVMIVGESPGEHESYVGRAFIGPSGEILWPLFQHYLALWRPEAYVTNLVKLNTWGREEDHKAKDKAMLEGIALDGPELLGEILQVRPRLIFAIGRWAINYLLQQSSDAWTGERLSKKELRKLSVEVTNGKVYGRGFDSETGGQHKCAVVGMLHPASALRSPSQLQLLSWAMSQGKLFLDGLLSPSTCISRPERQHRILRGEQVPTVGSDCVGLDTEGSTRRPKCISVSFDSLDGFVVEVGDTLGLQRLSIALLDAKEICSHHKLHDLPVYRALGIDLEAICRLSGARLVDTMIAAHQLGGAGEDEDTAGSKKRGPSMGIEPLGLKALTLRHIGVVQQSYKELVRPHVEARRWILLETLLPFLPTTTETKIGKQRKAPKRTKKNPSPVAPPPTIKYKLIESKAAKLIRSALKSHAAGTKVDLESRYSKLSKKKGSDPGPNPWQRAGIPDYVKLLGQKWPNDSGALVDGLVPESEWVPYAVDDAIFTRQLWLDHLKPRLVSEGLLQAFELNMARLPLVDMMRTRGMYIDVAAETALRNSWKQEGLDCDEIIRMVFGLGPEFNPSSPPQVAELLFDKLGLPAIKQTRKGQDSTAGDVLPSLLQMEEAKPYQLGITLLIRSRDTKTLLRFVKEGPRARDNRLHADISMVRTVSDRLASSDPNFLAWPRRGPKGKAIRLCYPATPGYVYLEMDYSQVELRRFAHLSGEPSMVAAFQQGLDIHRMTAELILNDGSDEARQVCKTTNFAILYLCSPPTLMAQLNANEEVKIKKSLQDAEEIQSAWNARFPVARMYIQTVRERIIRTGEIRDCEGGRRLLPGAHLMGNRWPCRSIREESIRQGNNYEIQTDCQRKISKAMVRIKREVLPQFRPGEVYPTLQVHDAMKFEVRPELASKLYWLVKKAMEDPQDWRVPILVDGKLGDSWGGLRKYEPTPNY